MAMTRSVSSTSSRSARLRLSTRTAFAGVVPSSRSSTPPKDGRLSRVSDCLKSDQPSL